MARPTLITVRGQFLKVDGTPEKGVVEFQSKVYTLYSSGSTATVPSRISAALDDDGNLEIEVPATNDPAWAPQGWKYTLVLKLSSDYSIFEVDIPYDGGDVTLAELIPSGASLPINPVNYAPLVHTHAASDIVSGIIASARLPVGSTAGTVAAGDHTHEGGGGPGGPIAIEDVTGLVSALNAKANVSHTHIIADVTNLQSALNGKAAISHVHAISDTTGLQTALNGKANDSHQHMQSDITGLLDTLSEFVIPEDLANVALSGSYNDLTDKPSFPGAPVTSVAGRQGDVVLTKSDVGLSNVDNTSDVNKPISTATQTALDGKANSSHAHSQSDITGLSTTLAGKANTSHVHSIDDITGLLDALDSKIEADELATVATTGSYNDLTDKPTIPTVPVTSVAGKTGDVTLAKSDVGLANVDNTSDTDKPVSTAQQTALNLKANLASPTFTGTVSGITKTMVGLSNVDNTADTAKPVSTAQQTALNLKANLASPTFTGTVSGITKAMVGLGNVDNTSDATKDAAATTLSNKTLASPIITGTPTGITKSHVGLSNVDNTSDTAKPVSTAQQTALDAKPDIYAWNGSAYVLVTTGDIYIGPNDPGAVGNGSIWIDSDA